MLDLLREECRIRAIYNRNILKILTGKPAGRSRRRWEDDIRMDLKEIGNTRNCFDSAHDSDYWRAFMNAALNLRALKPASLYTYIHIFTFDMCCNIYHLMYS